jgi:large subunit ribosomal protein L49
MLKAFKHLGLTHGSRYYSQQIAETARKNVSHSTQQVLRNPNLVRYPYYVPRNSRGSLPVYSDIRNNGTRILLLIRNVEGSVEVRFD